MLDTYYKATICCYDDNEKYWEITVRSKHLTTFQKICNEIGHLDFYGDRITVTSKELSDNIDRMCEE